MILSGPSLSTLHPPPGVPDRAGRPGRGLHKDQLGTTPRQDAYGWVDSDGAADKWGGESGSGVRCRESGLSLGLGPGTVTIFCEFFFSNFLNQC